MYSTTWHDLRNCNCASSKYLMGDQLLIKTTSTISRRISPSFSEILGHSESHVGHIIEDAALATICMDSSIRLRKKIRAG